MSEMVQRLLRQKLGNLGILFVLLAIALLTVLTFNSGHGGPPTLALLLVATGAVSRDVSGGTIQMILARPIRRSEYLLGRYVGILVLLAAFLLFAVLLSVALQSLLAWVFETRDPVPLAALLRIAAGEWIDGALLAATLVFFSTFLPGVGDLLAYFLLQIGLGVAGSLGARFPPVARAAALVRDNLFPHVDWEGVFRGEGLLGADVGRFVLALTAFLAGAIVIFSRREFSYGHD
jgi:ABC-type transport system involved in multi-copper enzyme maturation permease subunit